MTAASGQQALANARRFTSYPVGMCLKFVRGEAWKLGSLYGSAIEAWNGAKYKHPGDRKVPLGAPCFYKGGQYGHIVVYAEAGDMRSTDCPSSGYVSETDLDWPVRAWGQTYLGWTEDLNGVRLPLDEEDEMNEQDWARMEELVRTEVGKVWSQHMTVTQPGTGEDTTKKREQVLRELWQKVTKAT